jgi:hypothetical protein
MTTFFHAGSVAVSARSWADVRGNSFTHPFVTVRMFDPSREALKCASHAIGYESTGAAFEAVGGPLGTPRPTQTPRTKTETEPVRFEGDGHPCRVRCPGR